MRTITRYRSHPITEARTGSGSGSNGHPANPRVRPQLVSDAVIAQYIHDISVRHRAEPSAPCPVPDPQR